MQVACSVSSVIARSSLSYLLQVSAVPGGLTRGHHDVVEGSVSTAMQRQSNLDRHPACNTTPPLLVGYKGQHVRERSGGRGSMSASMSVSLLSANGEEGVVRDLQRLRSALNLSYGPLGVYVLFSNTASSRARNNTCCIYILPMHI